MNYWYKVCNNPTKAHTMNTNRHVDFGANPDLVWNKKEITVDDDVLKMYEENKGLCLIGRAGTGKTYFMKAMAEKLDSNKVVKLAFTNKAARNLGGQTIHSFLNIRDGKMNRKTVAAHMKKGTHVFIDEISMIPGTLWQMLEEFKNLTGATFVLAGDNRQLPPVQDEPVDFFEHPVMKTLTNCLQCEITGKAQRYDQVMWDILEDVESINWKDYPMKKETLINLCFTNKTRKVINEACNVKESNNAGFLYMIKADPEDEYQQDTMIYAGLPVIARKNIRNTCLNNENFVLTSARNKSAVDEGPHLGLTSVMTNETVWIPMKSFLYTFAMAYCTTVHKRQGDTIDEPFTIYEWSKFDKKLKYTAFSRATCRAYVQIN